MRKVKPDYHLLQKPKESKPSVNMQRKTKDQVKGSPWEWTEKGGPGLKVGRSEKGRKKFETIFSFTKKVSGRKGPKCREAESESKPKRVGRSWKKWNRTKTCVETDEKSRCMLRYKTGEAGVITLKPKERQTENDETEKRAGTKPKPVGRSRREVDFGRKWWNEAVEGRWIDPAL